MFKVNDVVSDRLKVAPLKDGEIAKYRLYAADKDDITRTEESSGKKLKHQQVYSCKGNKKIYDPFTKTKVEILNIDSFKTEKMPDGSLKQIPVTKRLNFPRTGEIILTDRDQEEYAFIERLNENGSNEFRDTTIKAWFYRVDVKKQTMLELEKDYLMVDALNWIRDADEIEIRTIFKALDADTKKTMSADDYEVLKKAIFNLAKINPILVLKSSTNQEAKMKVQIMEAEKYRVIAFSEGRANQPRSWVYIAKEPITICDLEPGKHKVDGLLAFFMSGKEGKEWYTKIISDLKQVFEFKK